MIAKTMMVAGIVLVSACATPRGELALDASHPANPAAPEAPLLSPSTVLALSAEYGIPAEPALAADDREHEHHQDSDDSAMADDASSQPETLAEAAAGALDPYICPMHPEVTAQDSTARCPKCGMKLVPREEVEDQ